jgi:hypothetical protein
MIRGIGHTVKGKVLMLGLSRVNVTRLMDGQPIHFDGKPLEFDGDIVIFFGETEDSMKEDLMTLAKNGDEVNIKDER